MRILFFKIYPNDKPAQEKKYKGANVIISYLFGLIKSLTSMVSLKEKSTKSRYNKDRVIALIFLTLNLYVSETDKSLR